jgi:hypothetical protein
MKINNSFKYRRNYITSGLQSIRFVLAALIVWFAATNVFCQTTTKYTTANLNLRQSANTKCKVLTVIPKGTTATIDEDCDCKWIPVSYNDWESDYVALPLRIYAEKNYTYALAKVSEQVQKSTDNKISWLALRADLYEEQERYSDALNDYRTASGELVEGTKMRLRKIKIGEHELNNIEASVVHKQNAPLLFGQSALGKFVKITIDNKRSKITFEKKIK